MRPGAPVARASATQALSISGRLWRVPFFFARFRIKPVKGPIVRAGGPANKRYARQIRPESLTLVFLFVQPNRRKTIKAGLWR